MEKFRLTWVAQKRLCLSSHYLVLALRSLQLACIPQTIGSLSNYDDDHNDDFKKTNRFNDQNNSSARASRFLVHFFDIHCTTTT